MRNWYVDPLWSDGIAGCIVHSRKFHNGGQTRQSSGANGRGMYISMQQQGVAIQ